MMHVMKVKCPQYYVFFICAGLLEVIVVIVNGDCMLSSATILAR